MSAVFATNVPDIPEKGGGSGGGSRGTWGSSPYNVVGRADILAGYADLSSRYGSPNNFASKINASVDGSDVLGWVGGLGGSLENGGLVGGAGYLIRTAADYFGTPTTTTSTDSYGNSYNYNSYHAGNTVNTSTFNTVNNTTYYNHITNNTYNSYEIQNTYYNQQYNTYYYQTTNNYNYYVTYSPTYYVVVGQSGDSEDNSYDVDVHYYQLPDGRNSFDLKPSDVWGTVFSYNCVSATSVAEDDGVTLGLWHLDENVKDSSAAKSYTLTVNSSNYVDTPFGKGLDIGEQDAYFSLNLTGAQLSGKTIEFRVYAKDNINMFQGMCFSPSSCLTGSNPTYPRTYFIEKTYFPNGISTILKGQWNTVAIMYQGDTAQVYVNGNYLYSFPVIQDSTFINKGWYRQLMNPPSNVSLGAYANSYVFGGAMFNSVPDKIYSTSTYVVDEIRLSNKLLYTDSYIPSSKPFDTNQVLALPDVAQENDIAIKGVFPVSDYRIGGVRPTYPSNGYVYVYLEDGKIESVQQYQQDGWYEVDACVRKNGAWVDAKKFDLSDAILDEDDFSGSGSDSGGDGGSDGDNSSSGGDGNSGSDNNIWDKLLGAIGDFFGGFIKFLVNIISQIVEGVSSVFSILTGLFTSLLDFANGGFTSFMGEFFAWLPPELISLITLSLALSILFAIIRFFWR